VGRVFVARDYWGRLAHEIPAAMERASTHHRLKAIKTPLLILHGDRDTRVPPLESAQVAEALARGNPSILLHVEGDALVLAVATLWDGDEEVVGRRLREELTR
jgi:pimeloyl-ACP methyl ester carboxylesterase